MSVRGRFSLAQKGIVIALAGLFLASFLSPAQAQIKAATPQTKNFDVIVYGGSPAGVMAAIAAARQGMNVALIAQGKTVGGSISNGLGATDLKLTKAVNGIPLEFFKAVQAKYRDPNAWHVTPKLAEQIFRTMLNNAHVKVLLNVQISLATVTNNKISCLTSATSDSYCALQFIDASYMGDLMPLTNTTFNLGRKDLYDYGDYSALALAMRTRLTFPLPLTAEELTSLQSLPFMQHPATYDASKVALTSGMPSFTYRFCVTTGKKQRPFIMYPEDKKYIPAWRLIAKAFYTKLCWDCETKSNHKITKFWRMAQVHGTKWDLNSLSSITNFPMPEDYFTDPTARSTYNVAAEHYTESLLAYMQGPASPVKIEQDAIRGFGMCSDEFVDNNNIPYEPYIREGRRVVGQKVLLATEELSGATQPDSIGLAKYPLDNKMSISIQVDNKLFRDYTNFLNSRVYEIPFSITIPKTGPSNLLVAVGVSTSPLAYGSLRMEPQYMSIGQATGIASALAIKNQIDVKDVSISDLQGILTSMGQVLHLSVLEKLLGN